MISQRKKQLLVIGPIMILFILGLPFAYVNASDTASSKKTKKHAQLKKAKFNKKSSSAKSKQGQSSPKLSPTLKLLQGTWRVIETYESSSFDASGPFTPALDAQTFDLTFKKDSTYCDSRLVGMIDAGKAFCEPIIVKPDGTITGASGSRIEAFQGYMKLNRSKLELYEGGKGYTKYILEKKYR